MLTHNRLSPPRWRAAYQTCDACGFQFWQEKQEQQRCRLCSASMAMPWANGQEQRRTIGKAKAEGRIYNHICSVCDAPFSHQEPDAMTCSDACRVEYVRDYMRTAKRRSRARQKGEAV